ncbi:MAG TPA: hypothetical protein PLR41_11785 [Alphaproteobacteria bacterium]|nr:hypothetical protein [Alphaproteobacteria bacterium]
MVAEPGTVRFSIGRVIGSSLGVYARNFVSFSVLALLIGALDLVAKLIWPQSDGTITSNEVGVTGVIGAALVMFLVMGLTQAAIIYGTFQDLRGQKAGLADCIARGLATMIPVIVGTILLSFAVGLAAIALIVPGVILALMWWVYVPVLVVEGAGITGSFGRSSELTRGHRWEILGLVIIVIVLTFAVNFAAIMVASSIYMAAPTSDIVVVLSIVEYVTSAIVTAFSAILVAVGYYYLRAEKEGVDVHAIAQVFD